MRIEDFCQCDSEFQGDGPGVLLDPLKRFFLNRSLDEDGQRMLRINLSHGFFKRHFANRRGYKTTHACVEKHEGDRPIQTEPISKNLLVSRTGILHWYCAEMFRQES